MGGVMKKHLLLILICALSAFGAYSCRENLTEPYEYQERPRIDEFPNRVGMHWFYSVHDRITDETQTVLVAVEDKTILSTGKRATVWKIYFPDRTVTQYVTVEDDSVKIFRDTYGKYPVEIYILPLEIGNSWTVSTAVHDTNTVVRKESISVPAGRFTDAFRIERDWNIFENAATITTWFVAKVGMIKRDQRSMSLRGTTDQSWQLLSYDVKP